MRSTNYILTAVFLLTLVCGECQIQPAQQSHTIKEDPLLQTRLTVNSISKPLKEILGNLSKTLPVDLVSAKDISEQRIGIWINNLTIKDFMEKLVSSLSHGSKGEPGYYWEKTIESKRPTYRLFRDARTRSAEEEALHEAKQRIAQEIRDMIRLSRDPSQLASYKGDLPHSYILEETLQPWRDALMSLSEGELNALLQSQRVPISKELFLKQIQRFNERWRTQEITRREKALANSKSDPYPMGVPSIPPTPPGLLLLIDDRNGERPERETLFGLHLLGVSLVEDGYKYIEFHPFLDGYPPPLENELGESVIDLESEIAKAGATEVDRGDMGYLLDRLSRVTHINVVEEHFYKTAYWGTRSRGPRNLKGTKTELLNAICKEWGYAAIKQGNVYVLWSRTWAHDRHLDIPESTLSALRALIAKHKGCTLDDRIEMAFRLSWPQLHLTLSLLIPQSGTWNAQNEVIALRLLHELPSSVRGMAKNKGVSISSLSVNAQNLLLSDLSRSSDTNQSSLLSDATLWLKDMNGRGLTLEIRTKNDMLLRAYSVDWNADEPH